MTSLFEHQEKAPLAHRIRPQNLDEFIGQKHLIKGDKLLYKLIQNDSFSSILFCGAPGVGKTTLSKIIQNHTKANFIASSSLNATVKDIKAIIEKAKDDKNLLNQQTILFLDEFHRFSKAQQDSLLASIEDGTIRFIGATTHNPNFAIIPGILSRSQIFYFEKLTKEEIKQLIYQALNHPKAFPNKKISIEDEGVDFITENLNDVRHVLNLIENLVLLNSQENFTININDIEQAFSQQTLAYDNEEHYDTISAYIKSMRDNSVDEALYWLAKMLKGGEDILFIARRLIIFAAEDIGNADPRALMLTQSTFESCHKIGMPEARIILSQATTYCATAPKSRASYEAINKAFDDISKDIEVSKDRVNKQSVRKKQQPSSSPKFPQYYNPQGLGYEKIIKERLDFWNKSQS